MSIRTEIGDLADEYAHRLEQRITQRTVEMEKDDKSHWLIYQVLGITVEEGHKIDVYQNKGRFLYRYAGSFLEDATKLCIAKAFPDADTIRIPNTIGTSPKTFEIDSLIDAFHPPHAIEIKWRDATTDGDHITKEHTRIQNISKAGYKPIRVMYYYPNREQAQRIQMTIQTLYAGLQGEYHYGDEAWAFVRQYTKVDLLKILEEIADARGTE